MAYRQSFESCPRCRATLEDAGAVRACTQCRGQWVLEPVLAEMVIAMVPPGLLGKLALVPMNGKRKGACPSCSIEMESVGLYGVELERCPKDHGVWFDPDELQAGLLRAAELAHESSVPDEPAHEASLPDDPPYRMVSLTPTPPEPLGPPPEPASEPARPIIDAKPVVEPPMQKTDGSRPVVPVLSLDAVVNAMMRGSEFSVGYDKYRWDTALHRIIVEGLYTLPRVISDVELSGVIDAYPDQFRFSAPPALDLKRAKLADVIARMKRGQTFSTGGSRACTNYGWDPVTGSLYIFERDETYEHPKSSLSESELAAAIDRDPQSF